MNQILLTDNQNDKRKNNNNKYNNNNSGDMKKIIIFFGIAILIFALIIIGLYAFKISKNNKGEKPVAKPELVIEETENELKVIAKAEAGISKIIYTWNYDDPVETNMNGRKAHEESIDIPEGQNTLKIKVVDNNNEEIETEKSLYKEENKEKPKIHIDDALGNGKVKITAIDQTNTIKYITYKWNDEEETTVNAENENQTELEVIIDVKRGKNVLHVTAINGIAKTESMEKIFNGVNNPTIDVSRDENKLYMTMTHDMGFKKIEFTVNGTDYVYDENFAGYDAEQKEISYQFDLIEGDNIVIIHAVSMEGTESTYRGKSVYTP